MIAVKQVLGAGNMNEQNFPALPQVTFYTKAGCHLCEDARDMLDDIAAQTSFELTEIDIRSNLDIFEQYRYRIPVIVIDETILIEGRIDSSALAHALGSTQESTQK
jgi:glutaredoxin